VQLVEFLSPAQAERQPRILLTVVGFRESPSDRLTE
jgi:hypothetical protein